MLAGCPEIVRTVLQDETLPCRVLMGEKSVSDCMWISLASGTNLVTG
jgi:hypothetical protein